MQVMSHWAWLNAPPCTKPSTQLLTWMMMDKMISGNMNQLANMLEATEAEKDKADELAQSLSELTLINLRKEPEEVQ